MSLSALHKAWKRVEKRHRAVSCDAVATVSKTADQLSNVPSVDIQHDLKSYQPDLEKLAHLQKDVSTLYTKVEKAVHEMCPSNVSDLQFPNNSWDLSLLDAAVADHLMRTGRMDVAKELVLSSNVHPPAGKDWEARFSVLHSITKHISNGELSPLREWCLSNQQRLISSYSGRNLMLKLGSLLFIEALKSDLPNTDLVSLSRQVFTPLISYHLNDIKKLFGVLAYRLYLADCPYTSFLSIDRWSELQTLFTREYCSTLNLSPQSDLEVALNLGVAALPSLVEMASRAEALEMESEDFTKNYPVTTEFDIGELASGLHNVFVCPVSKDQASEENPPILLSCNHVICKQTMERIMMQGSSSRRFKCPICQSVNHQDPSSLPKLRFRQCC
ncbi:hypothetical protein P9112_002970 [Eukaryota sp. TZLM1-RC]